MLCSVNGNYYEAASDTILKTNDEIVIIPPLSGGTSLTLFVHFLIIGQIYTIMTFKLT